MNPPDLSDQDVAALLSAAAPDVSTDGVVAAVVERSAARRRARVRRRAASALGIAATVALVAVGLVAWTNGGNDIVDVAVPSSEPDVAASTAVSPDGADPAVGEEITREAVPGDGDLVTPLVGDGTGFWLVRGSSSGNFGSGSRTISRWSSDGTRGPLTVVEGIPTLAIAAFDRLWVVVVEPAEEGPSEWRLKEIRPSDGMLLSSTAIPLTAKPFGISTTILEPGGDAILVVTEVESASVTARGHEVASGPADDLPPPPTTVPTGFLPGDSPTFSIEGTDLVQRKGTS